MSNHPDLVLISPGDRIQIYQSLGKEMSALEPPIWAGLIAAFVKKRGFSVSILDSNALGLSPSQTAARIQELNPGLTAIVVYGQQPSASTQVMSPASAICSSIKELNPNLKVILVGGHVSALPERTLDEEAADFVCSGEGLYTLVELLEALKSASPNLSKVTGLLYRDNGNGSIKINSPAPLVQDIDHEMEAIPWELLPMDKYRAHNWHCFGNLKRQPYAAIYTTLGCPYHCTFCCIQAPFKDGEKELGYKESVNSYRYWDPNIVIAQIDLLVNNYGVKNFKFADEMFVLNPKHVLGICDLIIKRGYDLNIWAYARVDTVKDNMIDKLIRAGFKWLAFGIESASERVRDNVSKGFDEMDIMKTLEKVRKAGIYIGANYIFGLPEDDRESMQKTLDLALEVNAEYANFYCAMAYPGSQLYETAVKNGWPLPEKWSGYSQFSQDCLPLPTKYLTAAEVLEFRDQAFEIYFNNPNYLQMVERKFGSSALAEIKSMTSYKLKRNILEINKETIL